MDKQIESYGSDVVVLFQPPQARLELPPQDSLSISDLPLLEHF